MPDNAAQASEWRTTLNSLPSTPDNIPAFYFGHGSPLLRWPEIIPPPMGGGPLFQYVGPNGPLANFLRDFGPTLLERYRPKGILVFSAHFETRGKRLVTEYGDSQPLLMDFFGVNPELYKMKFNSNGSPELSRRVLKAFEEAGLEVVMTKVSETRGQDARGYPGPGLDHGVFVPFALMFGENFSEIPIVEASIDSSFDPEINWSIGKAIAKLRYEGILILAGGLTIHNFEDFTGFVDSTAKPIFREFDQAVVDAVARTTEARKEALIKLVLHKGFRDAHPHEEHLIPLYVAAGAGEQGSTLSLSGIYGAQTFAFGL